MFGMKERGKSTLTSREKLNLMIKGASTLFDIQPNVATVERANPKERQRRRSYLTKKLENHLYKVCILEADQVTKIGDTADERQANTKRIGIFGSVVAHTHKRQPPRPRAGIITPVCLTSKTGNKGGTGKLR